MLVNFSNRDCQRCYSAIALISKVPPSHPIAIPLAFYLQLCALQCREKQKTLPSSAPSLPHLLLCGGGMDDAERVVAAVWISVICRTCLRPNIGLLSSPLHTPSHATSDFAFPYTLLCR